METNKYEITLNSAQQAYVKKVSNPFAFRLWTLMQVPLGFIAGMQLTKLTPYKAESTLPFKWLNQNPFKSIYFAAQSMAAELSTAALAITAIQGYKPSVATIIVNLEAEFIKKATGKVTFTCEDGMAIFEAVNQCLATKEATSVKVKTTGRMADGTIVSTFWLTWSFKQRSK
ncbi:DUF4442 domain-containing protein [Chondrinema litorale]|uniref:DUF4442 domain-containing protein n=1 Tax=Chondrinema litorale TaxID=2994555 RepID=UPI0025432471|nr:DUF4442 domain-containing protein [Chondrinema litorale]UZR95477.1 DUF4442 domain-containing protein [Chondrinema litorale]